VFNQMLAINETVAHLDVLVATGALTVATGSPVRHYQLEPATERPGPAGPAGPAPR
jgi:hypothetical protein